MRRWYELVMENRDDLTVLMTAEQGKPLAESKGEIAYPYNDTCNTNNFRNRDH